MIKETRGNKGLKSKEEWFQVNNHLDNHVKH